MDWYKLGTYSDRDTAFPSHHCVWVSYPDCRIDSSEATLLMPTRASYKSSNLTYQSCHHDMNIHVVRCIEHV